MENIPQQVAIDDKLKQKLKTVAIEGETLEQTASRVAQQWSDEQDAKIRRKAKHHRLKVL